MRLMVVVLLGGLVGAGACGSGDGTGNSSGVVSCTAAESGGTYGTLMVCEEVPASFGPQLKQSCTAQSSGGQVDTFNNGPCTRVGALGGCSLTSGGITETVWYYMESGLTSADVQTLCSEAGATYVAP
jgi:hypothetical protein